MNTTGSTVDLPVAIATVVLFVANEAALPDAAPSSVSVNSGAAMAALLVNPPKQNGPSYVFSQGPVVARGIELLRAEFATRTVPRSSASGALTETASLPLAVTVDAVRACERLPGLLSAVHQQVLPMLAGLFSDARFSMIVDEIETIVLEVWTKEDPEAAFEKLAQFDKRWTLESPGQRWGGSLVVATRLV